MNCFKAYDIRGRVPEELDEDIAYRIGRAYAACLHPRRIVVGRDVRLSSPTLSEALCRGLTGGGADVQDVGVCGTEEVYFATFHSGADGGVMITASHNPKDYNGMKLVREDAQPVSRGTGLLEIERVVEQGAFAPTRMTGRINSACYRTEYVEHLLSYVSGMKLENLTIVANPGNGCAGPVIDSLAKRLPFNFLRVHHEPDGIFPHGVPNPLLPENRQATAEAVKRHGADFGIAWDGDFDRCFLFDEKGDFIEGYYIVGLLASALLSQYAGERIVHDPRLTWNTVDVVARSGGVPVMSRTGHAFMKERMRQDNALYGGEMSAHHYFRDFHYCDSGMIPWLLVAGMLSRTGKPLSALVAERIALFPVSGEINRTLADPAQALAEVEESFRGAALSTDYTDGLSMEFPDWRFNLRSSNTEPVVRLNIETRADRVLLSARTAEFIALLDRWT